MKEYKKIRHEIAGTDTTPASELRDISSGFGTSAYT